MIYVDTSVVLAHLLAEDRQPPDSLWAGTLVSSRLLEYEVWNRVHSRGLGRSHADATRSLLNRIAYLEVFPAVLVRALDPFPAPVRTLEALHLASIEFLRRRNQPVELASYDGRLVEVAKQLDIPLATL